MRSYSQMRLTVKLHHFPVVKSYLFLFQIEIVISALQAC